MAMLEWARLSVIGTVFNLRTSCERENNALPTHNKYCRARVLIIQHHHRSCSVAKTDNRYTIQLQLYICGMI